MFTDLRWPLGGSELRSEQLLASVSLYRGYFDLSYLFYVNRSSSSVLTASLPPPLLHIT